MPTALLDKLVARIAHRPSCVTMRRFEPAPGNHLRAVEGTIKPSAARSKDSVRGRG